MSLILAAPRSVCKGDSRGCAAVLSGIKFQEMNSRTLRATSLALLALTLAQSSVAAAAGLLEETNYLKRSQAEFFNPSLSERLTISVSMVSGVAAPGVYHFPEATNLLEAIALAGGALP